MSVITTNYSGSFNKFERFKTEDAVCLYTEISSLQCIIGDVSGLKVLDLGCGYGFHSLWMAQAGGKVLGIDISVDQLQLAQQNATAAKNHLSLQYRNIDMTSLEKNSQMAHDYDLVIACYSLQELPNETSLAAAVRGVAKLLRHGGRFIGVVPMGYPTKITRQYGYSTTFDAQVTKPGERYVNSVQTDGERVDFHQLYISRQMISDVCSNAAFNAVKFHNPVVSDEGRRKLGEEHWKVFVELPLHQYFECIKG